jgi:hypothetical protein
MNKIAIITHCGHCPNCFIHDGILWNDPWCECQAVKKEGQYYGPRIADLDEIPNWCPLSNVGETND